jgi:FtsH-binding integral membrane protein
MEAEPKKPWWQATRTPASGFWLGGFWIAFGLLRWSWLEPGDRLGLAISCLFVLLGAGYLASSAAMLRRRRAAEDERRP